MSVSTVVKRSWLKVDASAADLLLTCSSAFYLSLGESSRPTDLSAGHPINQPFRLPKGSLAYVIATGDACELVIGALGGAGSATLIEKAFNMTGGKTVTAAIGDAALTLDSKVEGADGAVVYNWYYQATPNKPWERISTTSNATANTDKLVLGTATKAMSGRYRVDGVDSKGSVAATQFVLAVA